MNGSKFFLYGSGLLQRGGALDFFTLAFCKKGLCGGKKSGKLDGDLFVWTKGGLGEGREGLHSVEFLECLLRVWCFYG